MKIGKVNNYFAILRNIRNIVEKKVSKDHITKICKALTFEPAVRKCGVLPFQFFSAYNAIKDIASPQILDALSDCIDISLENVPNFPGVSISLCDNSGSACGITTSQMGSMRVATIGNLTGVITAKNSDEGYVGIFGDRLEISPIAKRSSIFQETERLNKIGAGIGGATENGLWLFWRDALQKKVHYDNVFVYSDLQCGHGGLFGVGVDKEYIYKNREHYIDVPKLIMEYRAKVNKNVNVFLVQIAGYIDTIIPEFYDKTYILGGWGNGLLSFANSMIKGQ